MEDQVFGPHAFTTLYPNGGLVTTADYGPYSSLTFTDSKTQQILALAISDSLNLAAAQGTVARRADVVGHSMGGLATRYFMDHRAPAPFPVGFFPAKVVHKLITVGTPTTGTPLATTLWESQNNVSQGTWDDLICRINKVSPCIARALFNKMGMTLGSAVQSLEKGYSSSQPYVAIEGVHPSSSPTVLWLNRVISGFVRTDPDTADGILGTPNDTIVQEESQVSGAKDKSTIDDVVHTTIGPIGLTSLEGDVGETESMSVWNQALYWLMEGEHRLDAGRAASGRWTCEAAAARCL